LTLFVLTDNDQALAAEPGFHDQAPSGVEVVAGPFWHTFDILPVLLENFTKNSFPCCGMEPQRVARITIDLAGIQCRRVAVSCVICVGKIPHAL
jgi:hypothetical protein